MITCAIIGATGLVGSCFLEEIEKMLNTKENITCNNTNISKIDKFTLFASEKSSGKKITFLNKEYVVEALTKDSAKSNFTYAIFLAGGAISEKFVPLFVENGTTVIDNSSYFRMHENVPLIVPEINISKIGDSKIIANPNCSTIQAVLPLYFLSQKYKLKRIIYSTYQAVSGAGQKGINEFLDDNILPTKFPYKIKNNCIPQIDVFENNGYTKEEMKMINETRKILEMPNLQITATCVRVPVINCHSESVNIEFEENISNEDILNIRKYLSTCPGIIVADNVERKIYPINELANKTHNVLVGRIRKDTSCENGINMWIVADNLRKGAATNALQILEKIIPTV